MANDGSGKRLGRGDAQNAAGPIAEIETVAENETKELGLDKQRRSHNR